MTFQVTPGYGASIATEVRGNAHHQLVVSHQNLARTQVNPAISASVYGTGVFIGSELTLANATRLAGELSRIKQVQVGLKYGSALVLGAFDIIFYSSITTAPVDKAALDLTPSEIANIYGVLSVPTSGYVDIDGCKLSTISTDIVIQSPSSESSVKAAIVSRSTTFRPATVDGLYLTVLFERT